MMIAVYILAGIGVVSLLGYGALVLLGRALDKKTGWAAANHVPHADECGQFNKKLPCKNE